MGSITAFKSLELDLDLGLHSVSISTEPETLMLDPFRSVYELD